MTYDLRRNNNLRGCSRLCRVVGRSTLPTFALARFLPYNPPVATRTKKPRGKGGSRATSAHALPSPITPEAAGSSEQFIAEARSYFSLLVSPLIDMRTP